MVQNVKKLKTVFLYQDTKILLNGTQLLIHICIINKKTKYL